VAALPLWKSLAQARRAVRVTDPQGDPRLAGCLGLVSGGVKEVIVVPMVMGSGPAGLLVAAYDHTPGYAGEAVELAEALAPQVGLVLELLRLAQRDRQATLAEERNRVARDIHDTLAQGFTGIVVQLNAAQEVLAADPARAREHLAAARELARTSLQEARRSVWALRPAALDRHGLAAELQRSAGLLTAGSSTEVVVEADASVALGPQAEWEVLRVAQEAVTNAVRHARCSRITVRLRGEGGGFCLEVEDDGRGGAVAGGGGLGLLGMGERAARAGGRLDVHSPPGGGTRVTLVIPGR
jgi:signal transduction histidine kinase